ncbi:hypothetical protein BVC80_989g42 [Macleaya cordata]|uniref:Uncharacterized protein n=1 Tax=Macleaya cordata TaxID=56857 RepID=A0A200PS68_MACCD|nr:hypothetical protein BVC80_989g42 [Macleaya cordata]
MDALEVSLLQDQAENVDKVEGEQADRMPSSYMIIFVRFRVRNSLVTELGGKGTMTRRRMERKEGRRGERDWGGCCWS